MKTDERFYAFIITRTSRSRIRHIPVRQRWIQASACVVAIVLGAALYGIYGLTQQAARLRVEQENDRLRRENETQRRQLDQLKDRVDAIEDASRRLSEINGVEHEAEGSEGTDAHGAGGPFEAVDADAARKIEERAAHLEQDFRAIEAALRERERIPAAWPVGGELTDGFGVRRDPFGENSSEFHNGQDIAAPRGTAVAATACGLVTFAGTQNGYGQVVIVDHGNGLTTRYAHLSKIEASVNQEVGRGERIGQVGSTGRSTGPHLHYEVRVGETAVNPRAYLPAR